MPQAEITDPEYKVPPERIRMLKVTNVLATYIIVTPVMDAVSGFIRGTVKSFVRIDDISLFSILLCIVAVAAYFIFNALYKMQMKIIDNIQPLMWGQYQSIRAQMSEKQKAKTDFPSFIRGMTIVTVIVIALLGWMILGPIFQDQSNLGIGTYIVSLVMAAITFWRNDSKEAESAGGISQA